MGGPSLSLLSNANVMPVRGTRFHTASFSLERALSVHAPRVVYEYPFLSLYRTGDMTSRGMVVIPGGNAAELGNQLLRAIELGLSNSSSLDLSECISARLMIAIAF